MIKKKITFIAAALLSAALIFTGCTPTATPGTTVPDNKGSNTEKTDSSTEKDSDSSSKTEQNTSNENNQNPSTPETPENKPTYNYSTVEFAKKLTIGWNLGNTLDAPTETGWGMPVTTKAMLQAVKAAGFKTIRIPVSWSTHVSGENYTIDSEWMNRVKEVVKWANDEEFYIILNVHHDNYKAGSDFTAGFAISKDTAEQTKSKKYLKSVWTQIATNFKDYGDNLIFEVLNEPRCIGTDNEWGFYSGKTWSMQPEEATAIITAYETECISAIRAVKGNENRYLMAPGYAGSGAATDLLAKYTLPEDPTEGRLMLSIHAYSPSYFALADSNNPDSTFDQSDKDALDSIFSYLKTNYTDKGIGAVMGEASASNKDNDAERLKWIQYYFAKAKDAGIPVVLWDNMVLNNPSDIGECHGWLHRLTGTWFFPNLVKAMMDTTGVTGYSIPEYAAPTIENIGWNESSARTISVTNMGAGAWDSAKNVMSNSNFTNAKAGSIIKISFADSNNSFDFTDPSWDKYRISSTAFAKTVQSGNDYYLVLSANDAANWKTYDISIVGTGFTVTAVKFQD